MEETRTGFSTPIPSEANKIEMKFSGRRSTSAGLNKYIIRINIRKEVELIEKLFSL